MSASFGDFLRQHIGKLLSPLVNGFGGFLAKIVLIVAIRVGRCFDAVCESVAHLVPPGSVAGSHRIFWPRPRPASFIRQIRVRIRILPEDRWCTPAQGKPSCPAGHDNDIDAVILMTSQTSATRIAL